MPVEIRAQINAPTFDILHMLVENVFYGGIRMPFGYSSKVFSHPAIEYIPLLLLDSIRISYPLPHINSPLLVSTSNDFLSALPFKDELQSYFIVPEQELGIILFNSEIETIKYRGNYATIIAHPTPGFHHVCKILTRYFYKKDVIFQVVDSTGNVSAQKLLSVPIRR